MFKTRLARLALVCTAFFAATGFIVVGDDIGLPAKGGTPETLFLEKVPVEQGRATAEMIAKALALGRMVIFAQMGKLTDPELGDKGFTGEYFAEQWATSMEADLIDITPDQRRILDKLVWAGRQSIDNNQERLNVRGVGWKNFLPAKWARETGLAFNSRTGIVTKQPSRHYRHPSNAPDSAELEILRKYTQAGWDGKPVGEFAMMGTQKVYRYYDPIRLLEPCLACHGKPKGEKDKLGFEKDGLEAGDVVGLISVTVAVSE